MTEKKLTDDEIIKDCPFCGGKGKHQFFYNDHTIYCSECGASVRKFYPTKKEAFEAWKNRVDDDLINRYKAENERLLQKLQQAKSEAYKEFVRKLKAHAYYIDFPIEHRVVDEDDIDSTLKEMAGEE